MLALHDFWVWDSWYVEHAGEVHAFYLTAPKALGDPDLRHTSARIGHAVSKDLVSWTVLPDALAPGAAGDFDDLAVWTGSIVRHQGQWHLFFTGIGRSEGPSVQRVGHAVSSDLMTWHRVARSPAVSADAHWYATAGLFDSPDEPWRDPWVFPAADGLWHMLLTAAPRRDVDSTAGAIAHCVSPDLAAWSVAAPLTTRAAFRQLEVSQMVRVDGRDVLVFSAAASDVLGPGIDAVTGTYTAPADSELGPHHLERAEPVRAAGIYAGRVVNDRDGRPVLLGFVDSGAEGGFAGVICDPIPLGLTDRGTLQPL